MIFGVSLRELAACIFMLAGAFVFIGSAIGMLRLPDFYSRVHASGNSETLGCTLSFIGLMILEGPTLTAAKMAIVFIFVFIANPIGSHILGKAAYKTGHPVWTLDSVKGSEAIAALNQEHILSEPLGNLDEQELAEAAAEKAAGEAVASTVIKVKKHNFRRSHNGGHNKNRNRNRKGGK